MEAGVPDALVAVAGKRKFSRLQQRRQAQLKSAADARGSGAGGSSIAIPVVSRRTLVSRELLVYLAEEEQAGVDGFDLLEPWHREGTVSICPATEKIPAPVDTPCLAVIARLFHAVDATSCQAERNFSPLAHLIGDLRSNILPAKVEWMVFVRLNKQFIIEESVSTIAPPLKKRRLHEPENKELLPLQAAKLKQKCVIDLHLR